MRMAQTILRCLVLRTEGSLCQAVLPLTTSSCCNSNRASIAKVNRNKYARAYPTMIVLRDGATITVRYKEPRKIIRLPLDITTLTPEEQQLRLLKRKPKQKIVVEEDIEDGFDLNEYSHLWKK